MTDSSIKKIGIIGFGNMGQAIAGRINNKYAVSVFDKDKHKIIGLKNINSVNDLGSLVKQSEVIILAVKPQDFDSLLSEIKNYISGQLIITIAAGVTTQYIRDRLGVDISLIRVMPNLPAQIGQGVSVIAKNQTAVEANLDWAWKLAFDIFSNLGIVLAVKEEMINAATAISGSGPAFFCHYIKDKKNAAAKKNEFVKMLIAAAVSLGFDKKEAEILSAKTIDGIIAIIFERNLSCAEVIKMVASKGGTTQAGLEILDAGGSLEKAVKNAYNRAEQLSRGG